MSKVFKNQMNYPVFFDTKNSLTLFSLRENFKFISKLYSKKNLPKVLMFTGNTLVNLHSYRYVTAMMREPLRSSPLPLQPGRPLIVFYCGGKKVLIHFGGGIFVRNIAIFERM